MLGWYVPGTVFGLLVLVPLVEHPLRYWRRSAILLIAATIAHQAMWTTGFSMLQVLDQLQLVVSERGLVVVLGAPSGVVFGVIATLATARTLAIRFSWHSWVVIALLSGLGGTFFAGTILYQWEFFGDVLSASGARALNVCLAYTGLFLIYAIIFALGKQQTPRQPTGVDRVLLGALVLLAPLLWTWLAAIDMR